MSAGRAHARPRGVTCARRLWMERSYGWVIVAAGGLIGCVAGGAMFSLPVYLPIISEDMGWSRASVSAAMTMVFIVMGVSGFLWGMATDRFGARPVVLAGACLLSLGLIAASRAPSPIVFQ